MVGRCPGREAGIGERHVDSGMSEHGLVAFLRGRIMMVTRGCLLICGVFLRCGHLVVGYESE